MGSNPGTWLCIGAALLYGLSLPLSRLLFDGASNPLTVGTARYAALCLLLLTWVALSRRGHPLAPTHWLAALVVGALFALISVGQLLAIERITVSLAALIFYSYPAMTVAVTMLRQRRRPEPRSLAVVGLASIGLVFALDVDLGDLDAVGVAWAMLAAASVCASFVIIETALAEADPVRSAAVSALGATVVSSLALATFSEVQLPHRPADVGLLLLVMVCFSAAVLAMYLGIAKVGSVRAALVLFLEPVTAILVAMAVLGERLGPGETVGAVAVVLAVLIAGWPARPSRSRR